MRKITLHNGQSPGDILVMSGAVRDLKLEHEDIEINVNSCCPDIFENNHHITNARKMVKAPTVDPNADNMRKMGYSFDDILSKRQEVFQKLVRDRLLTAEFTDGVWSYRHTETQLVLFTSKQKQDLKHIPEIYEVGYEEIHNSGKTGIHFSNAYHISLEKLLDVTFPQTSLLPDIHLSDEEIKWMNQVEETTGYRGKFWLINSGYKGDYILKNWGHENWQKLVNLLQDRIQFVQVGEEHPDHTHRDLTGVIDLVGQTSLRELIRLSYHAQGAVCHVTLQMHIMAAFQKPCVVVAGGRENDRWERYPNHRYLETNGLLDCCKYDGCWLSGRKEYDEEKGEEVNKVCKNMVGWGGDLSEQRQKCMAMIKPENVRDEILKYYDGGIL